MPWALLALAGLPAVWALGRWSRAGLEPGRAIFAGVLRTLIYLAAVLAVADTRWIVKSDKTATVFLLDLSASIPADSQKAAQQYVREQLLKLPSGDLAGMIVFGEQAMIELPPLEDPAFDQPHSVISAAATDLGAAIRLALAWFPEQYQRRIVLISDGNENRGAALAELDQARRHGIQIDVLPVTYEYPGEMWVEELYVPPEVSPKENFDVGVVINAQQAGPATLRLIRNDGLVTEQQLNLVPGKNLYTVRQKLDSAGPQRYEVHLAPAKGAADPVYQNNSAFGISHVRGTAQLMVVAGAPEESRELVAKLNAEGLETVQVEPALLLDHVAEMSHYDAILFVNVGAEQLPSGAMQAVDAAVHDAGVGLLMIGGERSFGPGGFRGTPLEEVLPVTMDQPQRRVLPNGALVLILHTVEIPEGNTWAKEIGLAAMNVLGPKDYFGVSLYNGNGNDQWVFKPRPVDDRATMARLIKNAFPMDMMSFETQMKMAHDELKVLNASAKHVVIISDGDPSGPSQGLLQAAVKDRISVSTVTMFEHDQSTVQKMQDIAKFAGGRHYHISDPRSLPQIFIREAATIRRSMVIEGKFSPAMRPGAEAFKGILPKEVPPLYGYTITNPKETAEILMSGPEGDVIYAQWRYGLGSAAVFTSDAKNRWAKDWVAWPNYQKIWAQIVRTLLRSVNQASYRMNVEVEGGRGHVVIDAVEDDGRYNHTLKFGGSAVVPGTGERLPLSFRQTTPGRYEASFDARQVGIYSVNALFTDPQGKEGYLSVGAAVPYLAEYRDLKTNRPLLERIASFTGGRMLNLDTKLYTAMAAKVGSLFPLWPWLLGAALCLFPLDIAVRRVALDWADLAAAVGRLRARTAAVEAPAPEPIRKLLSRKEEVRAETLGAPAGEPEFDLKANPAKPGAPTPPKNAPLPPPKPAAEQPDYLKRLMDAKKRAKGQDP